MRIFPYSGRLSPRGARCDDQRMVGRLSSARTRVHWLQDHGILKEHSLSVTKTYWVYRILNHSNVSEPLTPFVPMRAGDLPPDMYRVAAGTPLDDLFKRLVKYGCAEVFLGPYEEHVRAE